MIIELKIDPVPFGDVFNNHKKAEIRRDDRGYKVGDILKLRETKSTGEEMAAGAPLLYTGRCCLRFVTCDCRGYGLREGFVALSIRPLSKLEKQEFEEATK